MIKLTGLFLLFTSVFSQAAGTVDYLQVDNGIVLFSTTEAKTIASPACVTSETANFWSLSLLSDTGRANYSMLVTALATGVVVRVESAGDCAYVPGTERALRVWFEKE